MLGNLFYRGVDTERLNDMPYHELKYWDSWHETITEAEKPK